MTQKYSVTAKLGPSIGSSIRNWMKLVISNGSVALKYYPQVFFVDIISAIGIPFRIFENLRLNKKVRSTDLKAPPVFILGHWRSGTTHIHNLMCQDPQFGYITMLNAAFPKSFMSNNFFRWIMKAFMPKKRPMDNMEMGLNNAQEEEMALGNLFPYSFYNAFYFPQRLIEFYHKYVRFENIKRKIKEQWQNVYYYLLKKATLYMNGKRLVLKNPANTARIKYLLEMFPDAKFIHIYRNPYTVYNSTQILYQKMMRAFMLQKISDEDLEKDIFRLYREMMTTYFKEKKLIPKGNLVEVKFEDLEINPLDQLDKIYSVLNLTGFNDTIECFKTYLKTLINYKKNKIELDKETIEKISINWKFTIDKWGYEVPKLE
ncbi:MAG: sulfotransferase [Candidatus Hodarchaeota archaeon]